VISGCYSIAVSSVNVIDVTVVIIVNSISVYLIGIGPVVFYDVCLIPFRTTTFNYTNNDLISEGC
jgi:hypothetical protein